MARQTRYRLVVSDIDGTLLDATKRVPEITRRALRALTSQGRAEVVLASSRMPASIRRVQEEIGCRSAMVAYDGGLVLDDAGNVLCDHAIAGSEARQVIEAAVQAGLFIGLFQGDEWVVNNLDYWALREIRGTRVWPRVERWEEAIERWSHRGAGLHKIMVRGDAVAVGEVCASVETDSAPIVISSRTRESIGEFRSPSADKYRGLKLLLAEFGIHAHEVMAFGDGVNDLLLLREVGCGVAVENSPLGVKEVADYVTLRSEEDGVGLFLCSHFEGLGVEL